MEQDTIGQSIKLPIKEKRIIVGSFPTWTITSPDLDKGETEAQKESARKENDDIRFFYGSAVNDFWVWYKEQVDVTLNYDNVASIKRCLKANKHGIVNVITSATRKGESSFDYDLSNRIYNHAFFTYPSTGEVLKLLCTSKEVLNGMLLRSEFYKEHPVLALDKKATKRLHLSLINKAKIKGKIAKPIVAVLSSAHGGRIECLAIPSPGSPYRGLYYFGRTRQESSKEFLNRYISASFEWFKR